MNSQQNTALPVALVDASNQLRNLGRPLTKVQDPVPTLPSISTVQGKVGAYGELTRAHRSIAVSDAGDSFSMSRFASEVYPIEGPVCDMRGPFQQFGQPSRYDGRDPIVYDI